MEVRFKTWDCVVKKERYGNGRIALSLVAIDSTNNYDQEVWPGEQIARATVNIPEAHLEPNEVIIKSYSENAGMLEALQEAKIVSKTKRLIALEHGISCPVVDLLI